MNRIRTIVALFIAVIAGSAGAASAATLSYSYHDFWGFYEVDRFDSSLGTLTSVKIDLQSEWQSAVQAYSYDDETGDWAPTRFDYTASISRTLRFGTSSFVIPYVGSGSIDMPRETSIGFIVPISPFQATLTGAAVDYFIGDEAFLPWSNETYALTGNLVLQPNASGAWSFSDSYFLETFKITYTYTPLGAPVPEASTWMLMIVGFGGIGFLTRRGSRRRDAREVRALGA